MNNDQWKLIIFDVDGTLTDTSAVDGHCFLKAVEAVFGITVSEGTNWSKCPHVTDSGILHELLQREGRKAEAVDIVSFQKKFIELLSKELNRCRDQFREIPGAKRVVDAVGRTPGCAIAFASGGWKQSAALKLRTIGIDPDLFPGAYSGDSMDRKEIISIAIKRTEEREKTQFSEVFYIGDAEWDAHACKAIKIPFIGRATGEKSERLKNLGAQAVLPNFNSLLAFWDATKSEGHRTATESQPLQKSDVDQILTHHQLEGRTHGIK